VLLLVVLYLPAAIARAVLLVVKLVLLVRRYADPGSAAGL
jgi:hypothetical protein